MVLHQERSRVRSRLWSVVLALGLGGLGALVVLWIVFSPSLVSRRPSLPPPNEAPPPVGRPAPDFTLPTLSGGTLALHSLRGKPVVLNFWASWCVPCLAETPLLVRLHKIYGPRGVVFVGVNVEDQAPDARRFVGQYHVDYTVVQAPDETVMRAYALLGLPTTVFIGADGVVAAKEVGGFIGPEGEKALRRRLDLLLKSATP